MKSHPRIPVSVSRRLLALMALSACPLLTSSYASSGTWNGTTNGTWAGANWSATPVPGTGDTATFNDAGNGNTTLDLGSGVTVSTVLFDTSSAAAYTIGSGAVGSQTLTLNNGGAVTMNATVANNQIFNSALTLGTDATVSSYTLTNNSTTNRLTFAGNIAGGTTGTAGAKTLTVTGAGNTFISGNLVNGGATAVALTKSGTGTLTLSGANTNTGTTTLSAGTLKLGANNALTSTGAMTLATGGITNIFDLAGFSQTIGTLTSGTTNDSAGVITSSATGGALTVNVGTATGNTFGGTRFTGTLALTVIANNVTNAGSGNIQILNTNNSFSGGLRIQGSSGTFTTANLATAGQFTGLTMAGVRTNAAAAIGSGTVTLDNGQLFFVASQNVSNAINVTAKGGGLHMEGTGAGAGGFTGPLSSSASTLLVVNSNAGNSNIIKFSGDMSGFSGTLALDTTNIGGIALSGSALGNANTNLLWFGNGANGGTGRVQWNGVGSTTLTFGELNNLNSGAVGSTMSGIVENNVASTTATLSIGNTNATAATFQGVIKNGAGTVALTKTNTNTQILSGANIYTGTTTISGGTLQLGAGSTTGSLSTSSAIINNANLTINRSNAVAQGTDFSGAAITGTGSFTQAGSGTTTLSAANTYDGATTVSAGTLKISNASALGSTVGTTTVSSGGTLDMNGQSITEVLSVTGAGAGSLGALVNSNTGVASTLNSEITNGASFTVGGAGAMTIQRARSGGAVMTLTKIGTGALTLGNASTTSHMNLLAVDVESASTVNFNTVSGTNYLVADRGVKVAAGGTVNYTGTGTDMVGNNQEVIVSNGTFNMNGISDTVGRLTVGDGTNNGTISGGSSSILTVGGSYQAFAAGGSSLSGGIEAMSGSVDVKLAGAAALAKTTSGTVTLTQANTYSGGTTVGNGTLALSGSGGLGTSSVTVSGGTLDLGTKSITNTLGALTGGGQVNNGTLTNNSGTYDLQNGSVGAILAGSNGLSKTSSSTVTLSGANSYSGGTTISAGTLALSGSGSLGSGSVSVAGSATLNAGTYNFSSSAVTNNGTISGNVTLGGLTKGSGTFSNNVTFAGGTFAPGNSPGTVTVAGNLSASSASIISMELASATYDIIQVGGTFTTTNFTLNVINYGLDPNALTVGSTFNLFKNGDGSGAISSIVGTFDAVNLVALAGGLTWDTSALYTSGTISIASAIPEPSTYAALAGLGVLGLAAYRRRRAA